MTKTTDITVPAAFAKMAHDYAWNAHAEACAAASERSVFNVGDIIEYATAHFVMRRYGPAVKYMYGTIKEISFNKAEIEWEDGSTGCVSLASLTLVAPTE